MSDHQCVPKSPLASRVFFSASAAVACGISLYQLPAPAAYFGCGLGLWLSAASYIDAQRLLLLDIFTLPLILAGLLLAYLGYGPGLLDAASGAALGYLALWAMSAAYLKLRGRHGLGMGDAKLVGAAGAWCGALGLPMVVLIGSFCALAFILALKLAGKSIDRNFKLPFGPFLSLGFFALWCSQQTLRF